mgnify:CR=1 FL=1
MSLFANMRSWFGGNATRQRVGEQVKQPDRYSPSARQVTEDSALQVSAVWACTRLIAETIGSLPLNIFQLTEDGREKAQDITLVSVLTRQPNARMTSQEWRETMALNLVLHGNAYAVIDKNSRGQVISLWPLPAEQVRIEIPEDGEPIYYYEHDKGISVYADASILHIKLFGNGLIGLSPLAYARNTIGLAAAAEDYSHHFYINGGKPSGVLTMDQILNKDQREKIRANFKDMFEGSENSHRMMLLEAGAKYQQIQMNPDDLQMIQTRRFQLEDIARFFGVPSFLINDTEKTTTWGSGIEQMMIGFYQLNMRPYLTRFEQSMAKKLLTPEQRRTYIIEFNFEGLLRADSKGRSEYYSTMVNNGMMTRNEIRKRENLPRVEGGDDLTAQMNLAPLDQLRSINNANQEPRSSSNQTENQ